MAALTGASSPASPGVFDRPVLVIAIAGGTGSGKSTLANAIRQAIGDEHIAHISHDSFYKDLTHLEEADRALTNFDHPNSLDTDLFVQSLKDLRDGRAVEIPMYDFSTHARLKLSQTLAPRPVILCEGILSFRACAAWFLRHVLTLMLRPTFVHSAPHARQAGAEGILIVLFSNIYRCLGPCITVRRAAQTGAQTSLSRGGKNAVADITLAE